MRRQLLIQLSGNVAPISVPILIANDLLLDEKFNLLRFPTSYKYEVLAAIGVNGSNFGLATGWQATILVQLQFMTQQLRATTAILVSVFPISIETGPSNRPTDRKIQQS